MEVALVLLAIGFLVTLSMLVMGKRTAASAPATSSGEEPRVRQLESELDRRRKDLEEHKKQLNELRDELKGAKRKLYEQKESEKGGRDLARARAEVERSAALQLESVRAELAQAYTEIDRLKGEAGRGSRPAAPAPAPMAVAPAAAPASEPTEAARPKPQRVIRELNEQDKEKMDRLEHEARKSRQKAAEVESELRRVKTRLDTEKRVYAVARGELDLTRDKFKALEKRMNRKLLENDLLRRAIKDLEKKTGIAAERTEITAEEAAASDQAVEERAAEEAVRDQERRAVEEAARRKADEVAAAPEPASEPVAEPASEPASEPAAEQK